MKPKANPAKMPDWRDSAHYPDPADTSLNRWAWEFLRRNPTFEQEATEARKKHDEMKRAGLPVSWSNSPLRIVLRRWGISHPILPEWKISDAPYHFDVAPRMTRDAKVNGEWIEYALQRDDRLLLEFDLDVPIDPQLERARTTLIANQRCKFPALTRRRNQAQKFPLYLRVLDAQAVSAKTRTMLDVFSKDEQNVDDRMLGYWIRRATELRDSGYRKLLAQ
jgi:hypothetical protein